MTMTKLAIAISLLAAMFSASTIVAYAHSADDCLSEETEKCLDDDDFWGCYDFILEQCPSHDLPHAPVDLNRLKLAPQPLSLVDSPSSAPMRSF